MDTTSRQSIPGTGESLPKYNFPEVPMLNHHLSTIMAFVDDSVTYRVLQEAWKLVANKDSEILNRALALLGVFNAAPNGGSGYLALIFWATLMFQFGRVM
ncbi:MAG TPA: hypothetical protein PKE58_00610, partial [Acidobacteriota bacterium]|nr:hypothetical protein [Acidobacteriota bacterium]